MLCIGFWLWCRGDGWFRQKAVGDEEFELIDVDVGGVLRKSGSHFTRMPILTTINCREDGAPDQSTHSFGFSKIDGYSSFTKAATPDRGKTFSRMNVSKIPKPNESIGACEYGIIPEVAVTKNRIAFP